MPYVKDWLVARKRNAQQPITVAWKKDGNAVEENVSDGRQTLSRGWPVGTQPGHQVS